MEPRILSRGTGQLTAAGGARRSAMIIDVSRSGVQIELDEPIEVATSIELHLHELKVLGAVGNCRLHVNGRYRVGIRTGEVIDPVRS